MDPAPFVAPDKNTGVFPGTGVYFLRGDLMSVIRSKQNESELEFLRTARNLQIYTVQKCVNTIPKRYTFYVGTGLAESAASIYQNAKRGNSIYPLNQHEVQIRRDYFLRAYAELQSLVSQIEVAYELLHFDEKVLHEWAALINSEMKLIRAVIKKDRQRYKDLP